MMLDRDQCMWIGSECAPSIYFDCYRLLYTTIRSKYDAIGLCHLRMLCSFSVYKNPPAVDMSMYRHLVIRFGRSYCDSIERLWGWDLPHSVAIVCCLFLDWFCLLLDIFIIFLLLFFLVFY